MYEKIKHYLKSIFGADTIEQETVINAEYKVIMKLVTESIKILVMLTQIGLPQQSTIFKSALKTLVN